MADPVVAAIEAGRSIIVPDAQRAAALHFAWARWQQSHGRSVWPTPEILTWEAWLARQWRTATLAGRVEPRQLLSLSQERALWELALQDLAGTEDDPESLRPHAGALMQAAAQAAQSLLPLRSGSTDEERLLVEALQRVRRSCDVRGLMALRLAQPDELAFLAGSAAPLFAGQQQLSPLQERLRLQHWRTAQLLAEPADEAATPELRRAASQQEEIAACAHWCRARLQENPGRRLLVASTWQDPGALTQGAMLWAALAGAGSMPDAQRAALLAVEGGEPLRQQALIDDALAALATTGEWIETRVLLQLLRSPYLRFGRSEGWLHLQEAIGSLGLARWRQHSLHEALARLAKRAPAAGMLREWMQRTRARMAELPARNATAWAECFSSILADAGFPGGEPDSRELQLLSRWSELLDEFATLDAAVAPMRAGAALRQLQRLGQQASHQPATGDAAITFTTQLHDPVVRYDGIWVMGLTENSWPPSPRPDPYVPLHEQRRCDWPQAGVTQRLRVARWLQQRWRQRAGQLVLSHARQEGDVHHRPSSLLAEFADAWRDVEPAVPPAATGIAEDCMDRMLPPLAANEPVHPLAGGVERLRVQQECAFRAQAQWRLAARPPPQFTDGIPPRLRGMLLHSLLEGLWKELADQQQLLALEADGEAALIERHWLAATADNAAAGVAYLPAGVLERERGRTVELVRRVLQLERQRAPFAVRLREHAATWSAQGAQLAMRIDRVDQTAQGEQLLIDYKSGAADAIRLHEGEARPLQLAIYVLALGQQGVPVDGALLLGLSAAQPGFSGAWAIDGALPRVKNVDDWPGAQQRWQLELTQLLAAHLAGSAQLAENPAACRYCHLPAFCRRRAVGDAEAVAAAEAEAVEGDE